jgi:hypothetical protein
LRLRYSPGAAEGVPDHVARNPEMLVAWIRERTGSPYPGQVYRLEAYWNTGGASLLTTLPMQSEVVSATTQTNHLAGVLSTYNDMATVYNAAQVAAWQSGTAVEPVGGQSTLATTFIPR